MYFKLYLLAQITSWSFYFASFDPELHGNEFDNSIVEKVTLMEIEKRVKSFQHVRKNTAH